MTCKNESTIINQHMPCYCSWTQYSNPIHPIQPPTPKFNGSMLMWTEVGCITRMDEIIKPPPSPLLPRNRWDWVGSAQSLVPGLNMLYYFVMFCPSTVIYSSTWGEPNPNPKSLSGGSGMGGWEGFARKISCCLPLAFVITWALVESFWMGLEVLPQRCFALKLVIWCYMVLRCPNQSPL